jgi:hypothetical protein
MPIRINANYTLTSSWVIPDGTPFIEDGGDMVKEGSWYIRYDKLHLLVKHPHPEATRLVWRVVTQECSASIDGQEQMKSVDDVEVEKNIDDAPDCLTFNEDDDDDMEPVTDDEESSEE